MVPLAKHATLRERQLLYERDARSSVEGTKMKVRVYKDYTGKLEFPWVATWYDERQQARWAWSYPNWATAFDRAFQIAKYEREAEKCRQQRT